ncbi:hypothetical protein TRAPUB_9113 [Trametes pubescens]|uniref:Methyltransferase ausD n=1 Tax=Trametes pubescens TaxID=154538 RepID=A0A1M2W3H7_TRAPU|nr:hypothetical protein TRAPUB_9113 [Trametes pubescens]
MTDTTTTSGIYKPPPLPLDESLYTIDDAALEYMQAQTGILDTEELKKHIIAAQAEAYAVFPYGCIRKFSFINLKLGRLPAYKQLLTLGKERKGAIFLDIGCCFGTDVRKAVSDGYPVENVFWKAGHKLFKTTQNTFPVPFVAGDAFDPAHLEIVPPFYSPPDTPVPHLATLTSLNPLRGHVSAVHASAFFHLFDEARQLQLAKALAGLLSPEPGSMLIGAHGGRQEKGLRYETGTGLHSIYTNEPMFCHSPESWTELWDGQIFRKGTVKVTAFLRETQRKDLEGAPGIVPGAKFHALVWSVTRL